MPVFVWWDDYEKTATDTVDIETSIVSHATASPSSDLQIAAIQNQARDWWKLVFAAARSEIRLEKVWTDGSDTGQLVEATPHQFGWTLEIVKRSDDLTGFVVLPHRWIVERTFGWLGRLRLLCREHEATIASSRTDTRLCLTHIMVRRVTSLPQRSHENEHRLAHIA